jgi:hypothetical protein
MNAGHKCEAAQNILRALVCFLDLKKKLKCLLVENVLEDVRWDPMSRAHGAWYHATRSHIQQIKGLHRVALAAHVACGRWPLPLCALLAFTAFAKLHIVKALLTTRIRKFSARPRIVNKGPAARA